MLKLISLDLPTKISERENCQKRYRCVPVVNSRYRYQFKCFHMLTVPIPTGDRDLPNSTSQVFISVKASSVWQRALLCYPHFKQKDKTKETERLRSELTRWTDFECLSYQKLKMIVQLCVWDLSYPTQCLCGTYRRAVWSVKDLNLAKLLKASNTQSSTGKLPGLRAG